MEELTNEKATKKMYDYSNEEDNIQHISRGGMIWKSLEDYTEGELKARYDYLVNFIQVRLEKPAFATSGFWRAIEWEHDHDFKRSIHDFLDKVKKRQWMRMYSLDLLYEYMGWMIQKQNKYIIEDDWTEPHYSDIC